MFEWLAAAASSMVLGSSSPGMLQKFKERMQNKPSSVKERIYSSADITCVAAAIAAREASLSTGAKTHGDSLASAYATRATALAGAYAQTGGSGAMRDAVKKAWEAFNTAVRTARKSWQSARDQAWAQFRTAIKSCEASTDILDSANVSAEPKGE